MPYLKWFISSRPGHSVASKCNAQQDWQNQRYHFLPYRELCPQRIQPPTRLGVFMQLTSANLDWHFIAYYSSMMATFSLAAYSVWAHRGTPQIQNFLCHQTDRKQTFTLLIAVCYSEHFHCHIQSSHILKNNILHTTSSSLTCTNYPTP